MNSSYIPHGYLPWYISKGYLPLGFIWRLIKWFEVAISRVHELEVDR